MKKIITFTAIADLASIKCRCGEELYLGEVGEKSNARVDMTEATTEEILDFLKAKKSL